jgi:hypothetical protein
LPTQPSPLSCSFGCKEHWEHDWMDGIPFHPHRSSLFLDFAAWPTQQCGNTVHQMNFLIQKEWVGLATQPSPFLCAPGPMEHWKHDWMDGIPFHPNCSSLLVDFTAWPTQQCGNTDAFPYSEGMGRISNPTITLPMCPWVYGTVEA